jgi:hypothetical protein
MKVSRGRNDVSSDFPVVGISSRISPHLSTMRRNIESPHYFPITLGQRLSNLDHKSRLLSRRIGNKILKFLIHFTNTDQLDISNNLVRITELEHVFSFYKA